MMDIMMYSNSEKLLGYLEHSNCSDSTGMGIGIEPWMVRIRGA